MRASLTQAGSPYHPGMTVEGRSILPSHLASCATRRALIIGLTDGGCWPTATRAAHRRAAAAAGAGILHVRGAEIVDGKGRPVLLRGVAFGNEVWTNVRLPRRHHDEADYQRVAAMGMNAVRFYMNYRTFEADAAPGQVPRRRLAMARRQHRLGEAPRRLPDPQHARAAGRLPVAGQRQGAVGSPRAAGTADRALDRDRAPLQGRADRRRLRPAQRAGRDARRRASGTTWPAASRPRSAPSTASTCCSSSA